MQKKGQYPLLEGITDPKDLKAMPKEQIEPLAEEIRALLIERVTENGGHLASNLGVVELTLALHRVFSTPEDHLVFDVGHQCYVHKLLTGRQESFEALRRAGGLSGFPKRSESVHDAFGTGHSSTSLSAALGFAEADRLRGSDAYTVCVLGDGAYTGGMIHEALNNCSQKLHLIVILNENEMSISKNIGRFASSLSRLRISHGYIRTKNITATILRHIPLLGKPLFRLLLRLKLALKAALYGSNYFENLGFHYFGPADGNDEATVERLLREAKATGQSCVIHLKTQKGKGFAPAEATPNLYHGVPPKDKPILPGNSFSQEMGELLTSLATSDPSVCAITAAMTDGTGLSAFREHFPERFFDVGIAEEHATTFAAGLAAAGMRPVFAVYSSFLQRAYDSVVHDVALQRLPVVFCIDRAGLNPSDGATHHGVFDVSFLSHIPNLTIYTPPTYDALRLALASALTADGPVAIRYPNGHEDPLVKNAFYSHGAPTELGVRGDYSVEEKEMLDAVILTHGRIVREAMEAKRRMAQEGRRVGILLLETLKPYGKTAAQILPWLPERASRILFLEEEIRAGGAGMLLLDALRGNEILANKEVSLLALDDSFAEQTRNESILATAGVDALAIVKELTK